MWNRIKEAFLALFKRGYVRKAAITAVLDEVGKRQERLGRSIQPPPEGTPWPDVVAHVLRSERRLVGEWIERDIF